MLIFFKNLSYKLNPKVTVTNRIKEWRITLQWPWPFDLKLYQCLSLSIFCSVLKSEVSMLRKNKKKGHIMHRDVLQRIAKTLTFWPQNVSEAFHNYHLFIHKVWCPYVQKKTHIILSYVYLTDIIRPWASSFHILNLKSLSYSQRLSDLMSKLVWVNFCVPT